MDKTKAQDTITDYNIWHKQRPTMQSLHKWRNR